MNLAYTILYVENVIQTIDFYSKAFSLKSKMIHESGEYGEMATGTTTLAFASREFVSTIGKSPSIPKAGSPSFEIAFTTENVQIALDKAVQAGAQLVKEAEEMPWGQTIAYVTDNSGFLVEICTPISG